MLSSRLMKCRQTTSSERIKNSILQPRATGRSSTRTQVPFPAVSETGAKMSSRIAKLLDRNSKSALTELSVFSQILIQETSLECSEPSHKSELGKPPGTPCISTRHVFFQMRRESNMTWLLPRNEGFLQCVRLWFAEDKSVHR